MRTVALIGQERTSKIMLNGVSVARRKRPTGNAPGKQLTHLHAYAVEQVAARFPAEERFGLGNRMTSAEGVT